MNKERDAFAKAIKLLARRNYSEKELRNKLSEFDFDVVEKILEKLKKKGFIDDKKLAERISEKGFEKKKGLYYIINNLKRRGIPEEIINQIKERFDFEREYKIAEDLILKKRKRSLFLYLKGRGFSSETLLKLREKYGE